MLAQEQAWHLAGWRKKSKNKKEKIKDEDGPMGRDE
jgi:hypothetical protein